MYRGYCRIPFPSTLLESGQLELSPAYLDWKYQRDVGPKTFGFAARMEEDTTGGMLAPNKKYYRVVTGDFINEPSTAPKHVEKPIDQTDYAARQSKLKKNGMINVKS